MKTIEEKAKRYDEALERAKSEMSKDGIKNDVIATHLFETIFPELRESEDERIRKALISFLKSPFVNENITDEKVTPWIDWLEKQGERKEATCLAEIIDHLTEKEQEILFKELEMQKVQKPTYMFKPKFHEGDFIKHNKANIIRKVISVDIGSYYVENIETSGRITLYNAEQNFHLWAIQDAKPGDVLASKDGDDILIFRNLDTNTTFSSYYNIEERAELSWSNDCFIPATKEQCDLLFQKMREDGYEWDSEKKELKKIEQKFTDKIEPKFKVGDWITNGMCTWKIDSIDEEFYYQNHCGIDCGGDIKSIDEEYHLWTIQDTKSGDVLYTPKGCGAEGIFLIEGWKQVDDTGRTLCSDIGYRVEDDEIVAGGLGAIWWKGVIDPFYPATKEQRDLLFQKMEEADYGWDAEKKELKILEKQGERTCTNNGLLDKFTDEDYKRMFENCKLPKFKVGDWVTFTRDDSSRELMSVHDIIDGRYYFNDMGNFSWSIEECDSKCHLWTIQDAKDGDVFACNNVIYLSHGNTKSLEQFHAYFGVSLNGTPSTFINEWCCLAYKDEVLPATKEQCDLLFQKMKEAGYEWDAEKKELKKIEQKSADKVEPKFHEGDWVFTEQIDNIVNGPYKIKEVNDDYGYVLDGIRETTLPFTSEHCMRLWSIEDAKDGDVLSYMTDDEELWIMIYRSLYRPYEGHVHYHALLVNNDFSSEGTCCIDIDELKPATKEQRDTLFAKMKETGYEWDAEKKELKKIEKSENICLDCINRKGCIMCENGNMKETLEQKSAWSEEDEAMLDAMEGWLDTLCEYLKDSSSEFIPNVESCISWVKSFKERIGG